MLTVVIVSKNNLCNWQKFGVASYIKKCKGKSTDKLDVIDLISYLEFRQKALPLAWLRAQ
jgi:hypothetical protein